MTIDPVKIPQNVYVEDRIIGSITLRQIIICLLTGGISYGVFSTTRAAGLLDPVTGALSWTPLVVGAAFAFVRINGISLTRFCLLILEKTDKPAVRRFASRRGITISISTASLRSEHEIEKEKQTEEIKRHEDEKRQRIHELSALLDKGPAEGDAPEEALDPLIDSAKSSSTLPVDKSRISAEPLESTAAPLDGLQTAPRAADALIRDIAPPVTQ